jgi:hypothetical protein
MNELFAAFDADGDGRLNKAEYAAYLKTIGVWGTDWFTNETWDFAWPQECQQLKSPLAGISIDCFTDILYEKYRMGEALRDLAAYKKTQEAIRRHPSHPHRLEQHTASVWRCDVCGKEGLGCDDVRYHCAEGCDWDACQDCVDKEPALTYARAPAMPACKFGIACTRKDPAHFAELDHPAEHPLITPMEGDISVPVSPMALKDVLNEGLANEGKALSIIIDFGADGDEDQGVHVLDERARKCVSV